MSKSTQARYRFSGTIVDWNTNGYYDINYAEPSSDTNCSADETCTTNPDFGSKCLNIFHV
jgi:hypothetical protein